MSAFGADRFALSDGFALSWTYNWHSSTVHSGTCTRVLSSLYARQAFVFIVLGGGPSKSIPVPSKIWFANHTNSPFTVSATTSFNFGFGL